MTVDRPKVFVSYAHESAEHKTQVLAFATFLREAGVDAVLDLWWADTRQDWYAWAIREMIEADFVLVVASERYEATGDGNGPSTANRGVQSEAALLRELVYADRATWLPKILPVLLRGHTIDQIPLFLQPHTASRFPVTSFDTTGAEELLRVIFRQPGYIAPEIGAKQPILPPHLGGTDGSAPGHVPSRRVELDPRAWFVDQLKQLRRLAGEPTLADLEKQNPEWLKQQTVSDLLAGSSVRLPQWKRIAAFVSACVHIGTTKKLTMPPEQVLLEQWRYLHADLAVALDQASPRSRGIPLVDNTADDMGSNAAAPGPARGRRRLGTVPPRAGAFQCRVAAKILVETAGDGSTTVLTGAVTTPASVLIGLGGVGKTQVAADHAHTQWDSRRVDVLIWISARTRDAITAAYAEAAMKLLDQDIAVPERAGRRLLEWLAETEVPWLVVLDDLQDPNDLSGLWPPHSLNGQTVVTTRCRDAALHGHLRRIVDVDLFTPDEALAYLSEKLPEHTRDDTATADLAGLASDLGNLPLALAQAAAYLTNTPLLTIAGYRSKLADRRTKLQDVLPRKRDLPDEHERTVAATWSLSIEAADQLDPAGLARPVLELASLLDPAGIPATIFTTPATANCLSAQLGRDITGEDVLAGLACLRRFSLLTLDPDQPHRAVRVHGLVQRAVRDTLTTDRLGDLARAAADAVLRSWPDLETDQELTQALRSNTGTLEDIADEHLWQHDGHLVLFRRARSLGEAGLLGPATTATERSHRQAVTHLGPDHPATLITRNHLAYWRGRGGDPAGAATAFEELLADQLRILGPDHPDILATRGNIAGYRGQAGDPAGAVIALEDLLTDLLRAMGPDHLHTLVTRMTIAGYRGDAGDPAGAVIALEELLTDQLRVLGPDHPHTLNTRSNIAHWRGEAGDPAGAVTAFEELLADQLRILGPDHPDVFKIRNNMAGYCGQAGDPAGAVIALEELLTDQLRVLGTDHPDSLGTRGYLAHWRGQAGDPAAAVIALDDLLTDQLRVLGTDHPDVLRTRGNIAQWRGEAGDPAGAITTFEDLLTDQLRILGPDHPEVVRTRSHLVTYRILPEDPAAAVIALEGLLTDQLRILRSDHPEVLTTRSHLAAWRGGAGDPARAATETARLLKDLTRVRGPDHPDTLTTRKNLAHWRRVLSEE